MCVCVVLRANCFSSVHTLIPPMYECRLILILRLLHAIIHRQYLAGLHLGRGVTGGKNMGENFMGGRM